jgi:hypothetical protein
VLKPVHYGFVLLFGLLLVAGCAKEEQAKSPPIPLRGPHIVQEMVAAHGGLDRWRSATTVSFIDEFGVPDQPSQSSHVMVEQGRRRAYIEMPDVGSALCWDGTKAWSTNWQSPLPPRFLALLNYYFLNLPWLTQDPGVELAVEGTGTVAGDPTECVTVMMTFEPGTGDTPDDYYRLYIDPTTKRLKACAYVVTYEALLPPGVASTPEHLLVYDETTTVEGLVLPTRYTIYENEAIYATCSIRAWALDQPFDEARMKMPEEAVLDTSRP